MIWFKNVTWFVWKIRDHLIGQEAFFPTYIAENHRNRSTGKPCEDNLCFFRCLALHNGCHTKNLKRDTVQQPAVKWKKWKIKRSDSHGDDNEENIPQLALLEPLGEPFIAYQGSRPAL